MRTRKRERKRWEERGEGEGELVRKGRKNKTRQQSAQKRRGNKRKRATERNTGPGPTTNACLTIAFPLTPPLSLPTPPKTHIYDLPVLIRVRVHVRGVGGYGLDENEKNTLRRYRSGFRRSTNRMVRDGGGKPKPPAHGEPERLQRGRSARGGKSAGDRR